MRSGRLHLLHPHSQLIRDILSRFGADPRCRLMRHPTGFDPVRRIHYGQRGSADILGVLSTGRALAIECKTGGAVLMKHQARWRRAFERMNGLYVLAKSVVDVANALAATAQDAGTA